MQEYLVALSFMIFVICVVFSCISHQKYFSFVFCPQVDDTEVISFLLSTEIIPLCLRTMEMGSELSKTVSCF